MILRRCWKEEAFCKQIILMQIDYGYCCAFKYIECCYWFYFGRLLLPIFVVSFLGTKACDWCFGNLNLLHILIGFFLVDLNFLFLLSCYEFSLNKRLTLI